MISCIGCFRGRAHDAAPVDEEVKSNQWKPKDPRLYQTLADNDRKKIIVKGLEEAGLNKVDLGYSRELNEWALLEETPRMTRVIPITPSSSSSSKEMIYAVIITNDAQTDPSPTEVSVRIPFEIHDNAML